VVWLATWFLTRFVGALRQADRTAIEMEVIVRNVNLAVLIKASMFPATAENAEIGDMVLFTVLLYGALQMLIAALLIFIRRRQSTAH
jgi:BASS family bile acid:Na+ symporter